MAISTNAGVIYHGHYTLSHSGMLSGSVNVIAIGGGLFATAQLSGTYSAQSSINASASTVYLRTGERTTSNVSLTLDNVYNIIALPTRTAFHAPKILKTHPQVVIRI